VREQYKADSTRAYNWFKMTKDSSAIKRFLKRDYRQDSLQQKQKQPAPIRDIRTTWFRPEAIVPEQYSFTHPVNA
jgi:penicillin-binding protein 2